MNTKKTVIKIGIVLIVWLIVGNAYLVSKERSVSECFIKNLNKVDVIVESLFVEDNGVFKRSRDGNNCSLAEGNGRAWNHISGLAYWEVILTLPVIYRYRFD